MVGKFCNILLLVVTFVWFPLNYCLLRLYLYCGQQCCRQKLWHVGIGSYSLHSSMWIPAISTKCRCIIFFLWTGVNVHICFTVINIHIFSNQLISECIYNWQTSSTNFGSLNLFSFPLFLFELLPTRLYLCIFTALCDMQINCRILATPYQWQCVKKSSWDQSIFTRNTGAMSLMKRKRCIQRHFLFYFVLFLIYFEVFLKIWYRMWQQI